MIKPRGLSIVSFLAAGLALSGSSVAARAATTIVSEMTGERGNVLYDFHRNPANGWYVQSGDPYRFKLGFKQGERASANPVEVATIGVDPYERYKGTPSIVLQIIARHENKARSTAYYKVSISSKQAKDPVKLPLLGGETFVHSFAMKIDPKSSIADAPRSFSSSSGRDRPSPRPSH